MNHLEHNIEVSVAVTFIPENSNTQDNTFYFSYAVRIKNTGPVAAKLLGRHWFIVDGAGHTAEVRGRGVVGEQPYLAPGEFFEYTSYVILSSLVGSMYGSYELIDEVGSLFFAEIKPFSLAVPGVLH